MERIIENFQEKNKFASNPEKVAIQKTVKKDGQDIIVKGFSLTVDVPEDVDAAAEKYFNGDVNKLASALMSYCLSPSNLDVTCRTTNKPQDIVNMIFKGEIRERTSNLDAEENDLVNNLIDAVGVSREQALAMVKAKRKADKKGK